MHRSPISGASPTWESSISQSATKFCQELLTLASIGEATYRIIVCASGMLYRLIQWSVCGNRRRYSSLTHLLIRSGVSVGVCDKSEARVDMIWLGSGPDIMLGEVLCTSEDG
jgi:hypothetical protein